MLPKIISKASILVRDGASIIDVREKFLLAYIMIMQLLRGKQMRAHGEELYKKLLPFILDKAIEKFGPLNAHSLELLDELESDSYYYKQVIMKVALDSERLNRYIHILGNHIFIFLHLYGETDFVTSDNPVMFINSKTADSKPFSNGLLQKTTCVYYPLAANLLLWIVHPDMYFQSDLSMDRCLFHLNIDKEQRFISFINQKQFEQCHSQVYASEQGTLEKLEKKFGDT